MITGTFVTAMQAVRRQLERRPAAGTGEDILPKTLPGPCGCAGAMPHAPAVAGGETAANGQPPGGAKDIARAVRPAGHAASPCNGAEKPEQVAVIDETRCIGCTRCIQACPTDSIVGAVRLMHTVIAALCTGCELCLDPCPVDCIRMQDIGGRPDGWKRNDPGSARKNADSIEARIAFRNERLKREKIEKAEHLAKTAANVAEKSGTGRAADSPPDAAPNAPSRLASVDAESHQAAARKAAIAAAMARARMQRAQAQAQAKNTGQKTATPQQAIAESDTRRVPNHDTAAAETGIPKATEQDR